MSDRENGRLDLADADAAERLILLVTLANGTGKDGPAGRFALVDGEIVFIAGERRLVLADTHALVEAASIDAARLVVALNHDPALLITLADATGLVPLATFDAPWLDGFMAAVDQSVGLARATATGGPLPGRANEATLLDHLDPLGLASDYFSVALERTSFANLFGRVTAGVGTDIAHLPPLPDENYARGIDPTVFDVFGTREDAPRPVADAPTLTGGDFTGLEDTPVPLATVAGTLVDRDGSETLTLRLTGVPEGAVVAGATDLGDGVWEIDPANIGSLAVTPPADFSGTIELVLEGTATETSTGESAVTTVPVTILVEAVADAPSLAVAPGAVDEDGTLAIGPLVSFATTDADGSEIVSAVSVSGLPAGAVARIGGTAVAAPGGTITFTGTPAEIRAALDALTVAPPPDAGDDLALTVAVTSREPNGSTATSTAPLPIDVTPIADRPDVTGGAWTTDEDTPVALDTVAGGLIDTDGSESIQYVMAGVDPAASFTDAAGNPVGTRSADGLSWTFDQSAIDAGLSFVPPPQADGTFEMTITATASEVEGGTASRSATLRVDVAAVADPAQLATGTSAGLEDEAIAFGADIALTGLDRDGSETMVLTLAGFAPGDAVLHDTGLPGTFSRVGDTVTMSGSPAEVEALLASLTLAPALDDATDRSIAVSVTTTDVAGPPAVVTGTHAIAITAVSDAPTANGGAFATDEDIPVALTGIGGASTDTDGSESVAFSMLNVDPDASFTTGAGTPGDPFVPVGTRIAPANPGDPATWTFTPAEIAGGLNFVPPTDASGVFAMTLRSTAVDIDPDTGTAVPARTTDAAVTVNVAPVVDPFSVTATDTSVREDGTVGIGVQIAYGSDKPDATETVTRIEVTGLPTGAALAFTAQPGASVTPITDAGGATVGYAVEGAEAAIRATLDTLALTPPTDSDAPVTLTVTATVDDNGVIITESDALTVSVSAVADAPDVTVPGDDPTAPVPDYAGDEDTDVVLAGLGGSLNDTDGSETIAFRIEGVPAGMALIDKNGVDLGSGTVSLTAAQLDGLKLRPSADFSGEVSLSLVATATEARGTGADATAETAQPFTVTFEAEADAPSVTPGTTAATEDTAVNFGAAITYAETDADGSETITAVSLAGFPGGANTAGGTAVTFTADPDAIVTPVTTAGVVTGYTVTARTGAANPEAAIRATLDTFALTPPPNSDAGFDIDVAVTSTDLDGSSATTNVTQPVTVTAVADGPSFPVPGSSVTGEDTRVTFGASVGYGLVDADGSEAVSRVTVSGLPAGATLDFNAGVPATAQITTTPGGLAITSTRTGADGAADIRAALDRLAFTPATDDDIDVPLTFAVETTDTGGVTATASTTHTLVVEAIADAPTGRGTGTGPNGSAATGGGIGDEDTAIAVPVAVAASDTDSEAVTSVTVRAPADVVLGFPAGSAGSVTGPDAVPASTDRTWTIAGTKAEIDAALAGMTATPPLDSAADFQLTVEVTATESGTDGAVRTPTATSSFTVDVTVDAVTDEPTATGGTFSTNEDVGVALAGIGGDATDTGNTETISFAMLGVDPDAAFADAGGNPVGVKGTVPDASGNLTWTFTDAEVTSGLVFVPPPQADGSFPMTLRTIAVDTDPDTGLPAAPNTKDAAVTVNVTAVVDAPVANDGASTVLEDGTVALGADIDVDLADRDASQPLTITLTGIPAAATLSAGTVAGASLADDRSGAGTVTLTGSAQAVLDLLDTLTVAPEGDSDANFTVGVSASTTENGTNASDTASHVVTVRAVADAPVFGAAPSPTVNEDSGAVAVPVTLALGDADGTETYESVDVTGVPAGATLLITPEVGVTVTAIAGGFRVEGDGSLPDAATTAAIEKTLKDNMSFTPAAQSGDDVTLTVAATSVESAPSEGTTADTAEVATPRATAIQAITIDVVPVADPVSVSNASFAGDEDEFIPLAGIEATSPDADGSEVVTYTLSDVPAGSSFDGKGTRDAGTGMWTFTQAEIDGGLSFRAPRHLHGTFDFTLTATSRDTGNGTTSANTTNDTATLRVTVNPIADTVRISGEAVTDEDVPVTFGDDLVTDKRDTDGSEFISQIVVTMPAGQAATFTASGGASVAVSGSSYTITATGTPAAAEAAIRATLDTFATTPPEDSDEDISVGVRVTTTDYVDPADASAGTSTRNTNGTGTIRVRAVADDPSGTAGDIRGDEDTPIALNLTAVASKDTDGSETLSVRLSGLPAGSIVAGPSGTFTADGNDWIVTAVDTATLNAALQGATYTPPKDFSNDPNDPADVISAVMTVISTEAATGNQVAVKEATDDVPFTIRVDPIVDTPALVAIDATEGAAGFEDTPIRVVVDVRAGDKDGSETIDEIVVSDIPPGVLITDATGAQLGTLRPDGTVLLSEADLASLHALPPQDSNLDFQLTFSAAASESSGAGGSASSSISVDVEVIGVADPALVTASPVVVDEDEAIPFGAAVNAVRQDADGSEQLYFVIEGLPKGTRPTTATGDPLGTFIGGSWQVDAADMPNVFIAPPANFSGNYSDFAVGLKVSAITQENDGDQTKVDVPLDITIRPTVDGASWSPGATVTEDTPIGLAGGAPGSLIDGDGSERIVSYTFDLNSLVADAGIGASVASTQAFIDNHVVGAFTDNGDGTITVARDDLAGVSFDPAPFRDSNVDFDLPVDVVFEDTASVPDGAGGTTTLTDTLTVAKTFTVDLVGDADVPTVFAQAVTGGTANTPIAINPTGAEFGGESTDTDAALGRTPSEEVYYIVTGLGATGEPPVSFVDSAGNEVGLANGSLSWLLTPAELVDLHVITPPGETGTANLTLTTVAVENDGDRAIASTPFTVQIVDPGTGAAPPAPLAPVVDVLPMTVAEDGTRILDIQVTKDPADPTDPKLTVVISGVPAGATVQGATFDPVSNAFVADASVVNAGLVSVTPPADFSGTMTLTLDATATFGQQRASTQNVPVPIEVEAVADSPAIALSSPGGLEDTAIPLDLSIATRDADGSESIVEPFTVAISAGTLSAGTDLGGGVYELTLADLAGLTLTPPADNDEDITVSVSASTEEPNGDVTPATATITVGVEADPDPAILSASDATGNEDEAIALSGLSAALADTDGSETLSVTIEGVPEGSILSAGANNGDGSWTVKPGDLATLAITPPPDYSGAMALTLVGFTLESNGESSRTEAPFTVTVEPVADGVVFAPLPREGAAGDPIALDLGIAPGDATGSRAGENPAETLVVTLTGPGPFLASIGGAASTPGSRIERTGTGEWTFTGTEADAALLDVTSFGEGTGSDLGVAVQTIDNGVAGTPVTGTVELTIMSPGQTLQGTAGTDALAGGAGADLILGGAGADALSGGAGADLYVWNAGEADAVDTIADFDASEDVLDIADLVAGFDPATQDIADYVALTASGGSTTLSIDPAGGGNHATDVVELTGVTGLDIEALVAAGTIVA